MRTRKHFGIICGLGALLGLAISGGAPARADTAAAPPAPSAGEAGYARIDGFRNAHFGMTTDEVRQAIAAAFHLSGKDIHAGRNPVQRTEMLRIEVPHLLHEAGLATIVYVFGYHSHRLVQINISWRHAADHGAITKKALIDAGATLQSYFRGEHFQTGKAVENLGLRNGTLILFRGIDPEGHVVLLALHGKLKKAAEAKHFIIAPGALTLTYAADPRHPDVFRLRKGSF